MIVFAWSQMSLRQRADAQAHQRKAGAGVDGMPPSGPHSVIWARTRDGWQWRGGLFVDDVRRGFDVGKPAKTRRRS